MFCSSDRHQGCALDLRFGINSLMVVTLAISLSACRVKFPNQAPTYLQQCLNRHPVFRVQSILGFRFEIPYLALLSPYVKVVGVSWWQESFLPSMGFFFDLTLLV